MALSAELGLLTLVAVILLARRAGGDWRRAGKAIGVATMAFAGAMVVRAFPPDGAGPVLLVALLVLGWVLTVVAAMIAALSD